MDISEEDWNILFVKSEGSFVNFSLIKKHLDMYIKIYNLPTYTISHIRKYSKYIGDHDYNDVKSKTERINNWNLRNLKIINKSSSINHRALGKIPKSPNSVQEWLENVELEL